MRLSTIVARTALLIERTYNINLIKNGLAGQMVLCFNETNLNM
jgi:hypothetical protein